MAISGEWAVWFNGELVPEREARVPFRDRGFKYGDAVFDTTRTFAHRVFRLDDHIERFYRSLAYMQIDPGLTPAELSEITAEVADHNLALTPTEEDIWVTQRVTRGMEATERQAWPDYPEKTVIVECRPLPFRARARFFRHGLDLVIASVRRPPPDTLSPRAKTQNYINLVLADLEVRARQPDAQAILLDHYGNLAEGRGSNIFVVRDGVLLTPREKFVLAGISRQTTLELAQNFGIPVEETDIDLYDALNADEGFITSSSWCICPAASLNSRRFGNGTIPGPITQRLMEAYVDLTDCDWIGQYLKYAND